jgi:hypothetical protein
LVFDLAEKFRNTVGVRAGTIKAILNGARELQDQLLESGESSAELRRIRRMRCSQPLKRS